MSGLDAAGAEAFAAALSGAQREALLAHFTALRGTPPVQRTVPFTHAGPLLPPVRVAAAALRRAARSDGGEQSNLKLGKTVRSNGDGTYTITLEAYTTGEVIDTTHTMPVDVVLVLDQSGSMADPFGSTTRQAAMKSAVNGFIDAVHEKYAPEADHRIALVTSARMRARCGAGRARTMPGGTRCALRWTACRARPPGPRTSPPA